MHYTATIYYFLMSDQVVYKVAIRFETFNVLSHRITV